MKLQLCLQGIHYKILSGNLDIEIKNVAFDSRKVTADTVFVAIVGFKSDGHTFIRQAIAQGATAIVISQQDAFIEVEGITFIQVEDTRFALAGIASKFYGQPTQNLNLIGITGTNGKTSISYFIKSVLSILKYKTGIVGTMGTLIDDMKIDTPNTTPESLTLQSICAEMVKAEVSHCIMEVSSHALDLSRVAFCEFDYGIFTNLTPDHLELHKDMEQYYLAKAKLFKMTRKANIINMDDPYGARLCKELAENGGVDVFTYGLSPNADIYPENIRPHADYTEYTAVTPSGRVDIKVHIPGEIYVLNTLAVIAWAVAEGLDLSVVSAGIEDLKGVKGRFETVYNAHSRKVVVDFAHTEDGLDKALSTLRPFVTGKLKLVFGVYAAPGHDGDDKRKAMGEVAARLSDYAYITSDNPKEQDPQLIIDEVATAFATVGTHFEKIVDRKVAIEKALDEMSEGDTLLISGKGHETAQVIGKEDVPFNETEIVQNKMKAIFEGR